MEQGKPRLVFDIETSFLELRGHVKKDFQRFVSREHFQVLRIIRAHILLISGTH